MKRPKITTLQNGLRLLVVNQPSSLTATALVLVGVGSKYETKIQNGLSHFLEHMCFKGTVNLPTSKDVVESFDRVGAITNAFTSGEYTGYYAKGNPKNIKLFLKVLGDIYLNSTLPEIEIEREKGVIVEELNMYEDLPQAKVSETLNALIYGDQPAGWSVGGTKENVRAFKRSDFLTYKDKHYHAANTVVVVSGPFETKELLDQVRQSFDAAPGAIKNKKKKTVVKKIEFKSEIIHKDSDQAHLALGFNAFALGQPEARIANLLATVLGGGMSSRLFQLLREEMGVAYYTGASQDSHTDHGLFEITAGIDKSRVNEVLTKIAVILKDLKENLIPAEELNKALQYRLGTMRLGLESSDDLAGFYGVQLLLQDSFKDYSTIASEYKSITPSDLRKVARKIFQPENSALVLLGPFEKNQIDFKPFLSL